MHISRYRRTTGAVYNLHYHLVWCPKYRLPALWSRSYYVGSAGAVSEETITHYIATQQERA